MRPLAHSLSALTALLAAPVVATGALVRPSLRGELPERLGVDGPSGASRIWVHASSIGEAKAACRLLEALERSGESTLATTMTATGLGIFRRDRPQMPSRLAPLDHPWCIAAAMRGGLPRLSVLIETELWPSWIGACARESIPVVVASGRLSDRSFPRYRRVRSLLAPTLGRIAAVGARTELDADRFAELGVPETRIRVTGDLKLDPAEETPALRGDLAAALADHRIVVAGSTHRGEEEPLLSALSSAEQVGRGFLLVIAPRSIERADEILRLVRGLGRRAILRSRLGDASPLPGPGDVLVLDSYGELAAAYAAATIAFVGGTLVPVGGHNVCEPVHAGTPVLFGSHFANVRKIVQILEADGSGRRVATGNALVDAIVEALVDQEATRRRGASGRAALARHRGSVERSRRLILEVLADSAPTSGGAHGP